MKMKAKKVQKRILKKTKVNFVDSETVKVKNDKNDKNAKNDNDNNNNDTNNKINGNIDENINNGLKMIEIDKIKKLKYN